MHVCVRFLRCALSIVLDIAARDLLCVCIPRLSTGRACVPELGPPLHSIPTQIVSYLVCLTMRNSACFPETLLFHSSHVSLPPSLPSLPPLLPPNSGNEASPSTTKARMPPPLTNSPRAVRSIETTSSPSSGGAWQQARAKEGGRERGRGWRRTTRGTITEWG